MKRKILLVIAAAMLTASLSAQENKQEKVNVASGTSQEAVQETLSLPKELITNANNPIFLAFSASWCSPCHYMMDVIFKDKKVSALLDKYNVIVIDIDTPEGSRLHSDYCRENVVPYYILLDKNQNVLAEQVGASHDAAEFCKFLMLGLPKEELDDVARNNEDLGALSRDMFKPKWHFVIKAGAGIGKTTGTESQWKTNYQGGVAARLQYFRGTYFETGLFYNNLNGLMLPVGFDFSIAGPLTLGIAVVPSYELKKVEEGFRRFDIGARGGVGYTFGNVGIYGAFSYGILSRSSDLTISQHNMTFNISLSYMF